MIKVKTIKKPFLRNLQISISFWLFEMEDPMLESGKSRHSCIILTGKEEGETVEGMPYLLWPFKILTTIYCQSFNWLLKTEPHEPGTCRKVHKNKVSHKKILYTVVNMVYKKGYLMFHLCYNFFC